jgi:hypothetical protein
MLPAFILPLLQQGMDLLANAGLAKGKEWLSDKTGIDLDKPQLTSEDFVKLQQFQMDHEEELLKIKQADNQLLQQIDAMYLQDVQSARTMQGVALASDSKFAKDFIYWFAIVWTIFAMGYITAITFGTIPPENVRFADTILGVLLGTIMCQVLNFFFGSSHSSKAKSDAISKAINERGTP